MARVRKLKSSGRAPRIIAGEYKGMLLKTLGKQNLRLTLQSTLDSTFGSIRGSTLRPTLGRVRKTMFDVLNNHMEVSGAVVIDIFAGIGALGFEAFSRGASELILVESDLKTVEVLKKNAALFRNSQKIQIEQTNFFDLIALPSPDLVFLDPPYFEGITFEACLKKLLSIYRDSKDDKNSGKNKMRECIIVWQCSNEGAAEFTNSCSKNLNISALVTKVIGKNFFAICRIGL